MMTIRFSFYCNLGTRPQIIDKEVSAYEWAQAETLGGEMRQDYIYRLCDFELMRSAVRRVDVRIIAG